MSGYAIEHAAGWEIGQTGRMVRGFWPLRQGYGYNERAIQLRVLRGGPDAADCCRTDREPFVQVD